MLEKTAKFAKLPRRRKKLFLEAFVTLGIMRAAILTVAFKRLVRGLHHTASEAEPKTPTDAQRTLSAEIAKAIRMAANNTPWESACLVQALTAQRMLRRRGIPGVFYLGVMRNRDADEKMKAHAWSKCGDLVLTGGGYEGFTNLSSFSWEGS
jgi:hypothetical protein